jgi:alcohol dehydrogenase class IV
VASALFADISPNPRDTEISAGRAYYRAGAHDGVIAIGGGSGMDGAKAICLVANNDLDPRAFEYGDTAPDMSALPPFPPLICVPTTAGTGAETESTAMITDVDRATKYCIWHPALKPAQVVLDPNLTLRLPKSMTAWTGLDAMTHAIEAYCVPSFHPLCDGAALESLRLVSAWLPIAVREPESVEARGGMLVGSCLGGVSFLKGLGLVHAISHVVGAEFDTHHGLTNAIVLPSVLRFNAPAIVDETRRMAETMNLKNRTFEGFHSAICSILDRLEIPKTLVDLGVPPGCAARIAEKAARDDAATTNPRRATTNEIRAIVREALSRGR